MQEVVFKLKLLLPKHTYTSSITRNSDSKLTGFCRTVCRLYSIG